MDFRKSCGIEKEYQMQESQREECHDSLSATVSEFLQKLTVFQRKQKIPLMFPSPMNKQNWIFLCASSFFLGFPVFSVSAFKEGSSPISLETSNGDRYEVGQSPIASLETEGDLVLAGHTVSVSKNVQEDLAAFGQNVSVSANIGGDARIVGQFVTVSGSVGGISLLQGQTITIDEGGDSGKIEGDLSSLVNKCGYTLPCKEMFYYCGRSIYCEHNCGRCTYFFTKCDVWRTGENYGKRNPYRLGKYHPQRKSGRRHHFS